MRTEEKRATLEQMLIRKSEEADRYRAENEELREVLIELSHVEGLREMPQRVEVQNRMKAAWVRARHVLLEGEE